MKATDVRAAHADDAAAIVAIAHTTLWKKDDYLRRQIAEGNVHVAIDGDAVAGFIVWNEEFFALPFVWLVAVALHYRRRGVAALLFDAFETAHAGKRLFSSTNRSHAAMQRFFERRGYRRSGGLDLDLGDPEVFYQRDPLVRA